MFCSVDGDALYSKIGLAIEFIGPKKADETKMNSMEKDINFLANPSHFLDYFFPKSFWNSCYY